MQTAVLSREEKGRMIAEKHDQVMRVDESVVQGCFSVKGFEL